MFSFLQNTKFTLEQIASAHAKVKSGADFPAYVQDLIRIGVKLCVTSASNGQTIFYGVEGHRLESPVLFDAGKVATQLDLHQFKQDLLANQQGQTDFLAFCSDSAKSGVAQWRVDTTKMTCTYFDLAGNEVLTEHIPVLRN